MNAVASVAGYFKKYVLGQTLVRRNPFYYERACADLALVETLDCAGRRAWVNERTARTLEVARRTAYGVAAGAGMELSDWPLLEKEPLRHRLRDFTAGQPWLAAPATTGGTSGMPLRVLRSLQAIVFEQAIIDRVIAMAGADVRTARTVILRGDNPRDIELSPNPDSEVINGGRMLTMSANAVTHVSVENVVNNIEAFAPGLLCAYPTALETLCRYLRDSDRHISLPAVVTSSEVFRTEAWRMCEQRLGARILDYYGQAERVAFACASAPREYRFSCAYSRVELIPHEGGLLTGNSPYRQYEIVGTSFWNEILPLVRYRTGDLIRVPADWGSAELEELALGIRTFEGVLGRQQEIIVCPQPVRLSGVGCIPRAVDNVIRLQLVQERLDAVRVLVLPTPEFAANDASNLLANVRARVPDDVDVTVEIVSRLERTPRGKTPLIVHRPAVHDALRSNGLEPLFTR